MTDSLRVSLHPAAMHLRECIRDCQSQPQATVAPRSRSISLPKTIEHVRKKVRRNADASIDDCEIRLRSAQPGMHSHFPARIGELDRIRDHVPGNLLQTKR